MFLKPGYRVGFESIEWGKLVDVRPIGSGGMAELFLADRTSALGIQRRLVIKRIHQRLFKDPESRTLFEQEARIHSRLNHPHIVEFYDLGADEDYLYLALEYVEGGDLFHLNEITRDRDWRERAALALQLLKEIAEAFTHLHQIAVHQDVSGSNILYSTSGSFKLCDFGLARMVNEPAVARFRIGQGKFRYMSPEQLTGASIDHRSDIFSLGLCAAELFSGRKLYAALPRKDLLKLLRQGTYLKSISELGLPLGLRAIIERCVQPSPQDRFQNARELLDSASTAMAELICQFGPHSLSRSLLTQQSSSEKIYIQNHVNPKQSEIRSESLAPKWAKLLTLAIASPVLLFVPWIVRLSKSAARPTKMAPATPP